MHGSIVIALSAAGTGIGARIVSGYRQL